MCYKQLCCADSDEQFWEHEYNAHGTCNINDFDEVEYFNATLELHEAFPIDVSRQTCNSVSVACQGQCLE